MILPSIETPADIKGLSTEELVQLCEEIRTFIVDAVTTTGGHLGSNLGAVELTLAVHRVFDSPRDVILWDTGHQAYVHKLLTGRRFGFKTLKQAGGMSGYPNRSESEHDWIENSHASTALSYAHGIANAFNLRGIDEERRVVAVVGDGALTGGMAYEALNNLGHSGRRVVIVLNDNGRSYAPTVSQLSQSLTALRLNPTYTAARERLRLRLRELPALGGLAYSGVHSVTSALREMVTPHTFFEALGVRYAGPIDGHDIEHMEQAFIQCRRVGRSRSWSTSSLRRGGVTGRPKQTRSSACTTSRRTLWSLRTPSGVRPGWPSGARPVRTAVAWPRRARCPSGRRARTAALGDVRRRLLARLAGRGGGGFSDRRTHGGHARTDRAALLPGSLPRALLRRGHRRAARGDVCGRHGNGRIAAGGGRVLHVLLPGVRPGQPGCWSARVPRRLHARPGRHHGRRRAEPPWCARHRTGAVDSRHDGVRTVGGGRDRADVAGRARTARPFVDSLPQGCRPPHRPG